MPAVLSPGFTEIKFHVIAHGLLRNLKSAVWGVWFSIPSPLDEEPPYGDGRILAEYTVFT